MVLETNDLSFIRIVYQCKFESDKILEADDEIFLKNNAFPNNWDVFNPPKDDTLNFKIIKTRRYFFLSYFLDEGEFDEWKRSVLSAYVAAIPWSLFNYYGRDLVLIEEFLRKYKKDRLNGRPILNFKKGGDNIVYKPSELQEMIKKNIEFLPLVAKMIEKMKEEKHLFILSQPEYLKKYIGFLYAICPRSFLNTLTVLSENGHKTYKENNSLFLTTQIPYSTKLNFIQKIINKRHGYRNLIELDSKITKHWQKTPFVKKLDACIKYISNTDFGDKFEKFYLIVLDFLDIIFVGNHVSLMEIYTQGKYKNCEGLYEFVGSLEKKLLSKKH